MSETIAIHWFRQDLRLADNPALALAAQHDRVLPIYIFDDYNAGDHALGAASQWWLHHSLQALSASLSGALSLYKGDPLSILEKIITRHNVKAVYWNRCHEPWRMQRDAIIQQQLKKRGIEVISKNGSLLWEPWQISKKDGTHYKVFTPFYRKGCLQVQPPRQPLLAPTTIRYQTDHPNTLNLNQLKLLPTTNWDKKFKSLWTAGEDSAQKQLEQFINQGLAHYKIGRDFPAKPYVSRLSPHLHFGEVSPNQLWYTIRSLGDNDNIDYFCSELAWREFSYSQLYYNPNLANKNLQIKFDAFPWQDDEQLLVAWQHGQTGIPFVDAGMRELWQTGYMHNRVRMVVGSFLVKNLRLHWQHGERWFWDTLLDADLANNSASWQWVAGCGADAAPYFRIFNPVTQGQKFDPDGAYIRRFVPEIAQLPNKYLFSPWQAPKATLADANLTLGQDYPLPIVDLQQSRQAALEAFKSLP